MELVDEETPLVKGKNPRIENDDDASNDSRDFEPLIDRVKDVIRVYWFLGLIAFGGPTAHVGIFQDHLVRVHQWLKEDLFLELFALAQGLPGPSSSQLIISTAATHGGVLGGSIAFLMWSLPGFIVLTTASLFLYGIIDPSNPPIWLLGVPPAAVALIFKAFYGFAQKLDTLGVALAMLACAVSVLINHDENIPSNSSQIVYPVLLFGGGLLTYLDAHRSKPIGTYSKLPGQDDGPVVQTALDRKLGYKIGMEIHHGIFMFLLWLVLLVGSIALVNRGYDNKYLEIFEIFYRTGSLVFGGGVVIVPMLQNEVVPKWMTDDQFFQGLGLAQSMPGPFFNFASFLGGTYAGLPGAIVANLGLMGPGFILIFAMLPFWSKARHYSWFQAIIRGLNASAVGLIGGGCIFLYTKSVSDAADAIVFVLCGGLASFYDFGAPQTIAIGALIGAALASSNLGQLPY
mmetsp:Transcript_25854/g.53072  ORF Transcript_25854/g.53072 Transcript_25854/m.53072 type:complete len:458 (-) Transcript_25854:48-1421(-)